MELVQVVETVQFDTEQEADGYIQERKDKQDENHYLVTQTVKTRKEIKKTGDEYWLVKLTMKYDR